MTWRSPALQALLLVLNLTSVVWAEVEIRLTLPLSVEHRQVADSLRRTKPQAAAAFAQVRDEAAGVLGRSPRPLSVLHYEGVLGTDPRRQQTEDHLRDMDMLALVTQAHSGSPTSGYAAFIKAFVWAWATTYLPTGNPINENKLEPVYIGYYLTRDQFSSAERQRIESWLLTIAKYENSRTSTDNWETKRFKIIGLIALATGRADLMDTAVNRFRKYLPASLYGDGSSSDFHERDALGYHTGAVLPLMAFCLTAEQAGIRIDGKSLYEWEAANGASVRKSVHFLDAYVLGEKTHTEFQDTKVQFDRDRCKAGLTQYCPHTWRPSEGTASEIYQLASGFEPSLSAMAARILGTTSTEYPTWMTVLAKAMSASTTPPPPPPPLPAGSVAPLGGWVVGASRPIVNGADRALVVLVHAESDAQGAGLSQVTYGGKVLQKITDRVQGDGLASAYAGAWVLFESQIAAASGTAIALTWARAPSKAATIQSAFYGGVRQGVWAGAKGSAGGTGTTLQTPILATVAGDRVLYAITNGSTDAAFGPANGFVELVENSGTGIRFSSAHKGATGAAETPKVSIAGGNRSAMIGFVLQKAGTGSAASEVSINFQPDGAATPAGFLKDAGHAFGDRGNGYAYGWSVDNRAEARDRSGTAALEYRTLNHMQKSGTRTWSIAVPNGSYHVVVVCGDSSYTDQLNHLSIEGMRLADADGQDHHDQYRTTVSVTDGRLTVAPAADAVNAKLNFITIAMASPTSISRAPADHELLDGIAWLDHRREAGTGIRGDGFVPAGVLASRGGSVIGAR